MIREWIRVHRQETLFGLAVVGVLIALVVLFAPLIAAGLAIVGGPAIGYAVVHPENVEKWGGRALGAASFASVSAERNGLSAEMQGLINGARNDLREELPDVMPLPVRVKFVRTEEDVVALRDGEVVISLRNPRRRAENTVKATMAYVSAATIRPARPYVGSEVMAGIDYSLTKRILREADPNALDYFLTEVWEPAMRQLVGAREICDEVEQIERKGLLARVLLAEYLDLGRRMYGEFPSPAIHAEARAFLRYTARFASRTAQHPFPLGFRDRHIRIGIVLVGDRTRAELEGVRPYVRACQFHLKKGVDAVYVLGRGARRVIVEATAAEMEKDGRVLGVDISEYLERIGGERVVAVCARVLVDQRRVAPTLLSPRPGPLRGGKGGERPPSDRRVV